MHCSGRGIWEGENEGREGEKYIVLQRPLAQKDSRHGASMLLFNFLTVSVQQWQI